MYEHTIDLQVWSRKLFIALLLPVSRPWLQPHWCLLPCRKQLQVDDRIHLGPNNSLLVYRYNKHNAALESMSFNFGIQPNNNQPTITVKLLTDTSTTQTPPHYGWFIINFFKPFLCNMDSWLGETKFHTTYIPLKVTIQTLESVSAVKRLYYKHESSSSKLQLWVHVCQKCWKLTGLKT